MSYNTIKSLIFQEIFRHFFNNRNLYYKALKIKKKLYFLTNIVNVKIKDENSKTPLPQRQGRINENVLNKIKEQ